MADDRKRRDRDFQRPKTGVDEFEDEGPTPLPQTMEEAFNWHRFAERINRLELVQGAFTQSVARLETLVDEFALPSVKGLMAQIDALLTRQERNSQRLETFFDEQWPKLCRSVESIVEQHALIKQEQAQFAATLYQHAERIEKTETALTAIEKWCADRDRRDGEQAAATTAAAAERKRLFSWARVGFAVAGALITAAITQGPTVIAWLTR